MKKTLLLVFAGILALGFSLCVGCTSTEKADPEPLELDTALEVKGLTIYYPNSWMLDEGSIPDTSIAYSSNYGMVIVNVTDTMDASINKDSEEAVLDLFFEGYYSSMEISDIPYQLVGEPVRKTQDGCVAESAEIQATVDDVNYKGYLFVGLNSKGAGTVVALVPEDGDEVEYEAIKRIVDGAVFQ